MKTNFFWIYMLECENGSLYTGYTSNLAKRYRQHKSQKTDAKFTRSFKPLKIAQCWRFYGTKGTAMKIEKFIQGRNRKDKEALVKSPETLKTVIHEKLSLKLDIFTFDPVKVEKESLKCELKDLLKGKDPFPDIQAGDF